MIRSFIPASREAWLAERRKYVTATDAVAITGLVTWANAHEVLLEKKGLLPEKKLSRPMLIGNLLEPLIREQFASRFKVVAWESQGERLYVDDARHLAATPDGIHFLSESRRGLEIKTSMNPWRGDQLPARVAMQTLHQAVLGAFNEGYVAHLEVSEDQQEEIILRAAAGKPLSLEGLRDIEYWPFMHHPDDMEAHAQKFHAWYENHVLFGSPLPEQMAPVKPDLAGAAQAEDLVMRYLDTKFLHDEAKDKAEAYKKTMQEIQEQFVQANPQAKQFLGAGTKISRAFIPGQMKVDHEGILNALAIKHPEINPEIREIEANFITYGGGYNRWTVSTKK